MDDVFLSLLTNPHILFQPRILAMQQQHFAPGFFPVPPHPAGPPAFGNFAAVFPPKQQNTQQQSTQPRLNTGRGRTNSMTEKDHMSPSLSASAQPFIPLQVCIFLVIFLMKEL